MAPKAKNQEDNQQSVVPLPFYKRFNIEVNEEETRERFVNRVLTGIESTFPWIENPFNRDSWQTGTIQLLALLAGIRYQLHDTFSKYVKNDFTECLKLVECLYDALKAPQKKQLDDLVQAIISMSEVDLGIEWTGDSFHPVGAKLLDDELVNEPLSWLSDMKYTQVLEPFRKGLSHYIEAKHQPERLWLTRLLMYMRH